jgi:hypothetical protein
MGNNKPFLPRAVFVVVNVWLWLVLLETTVINGFVLRYHFATHTLLASKTNRIVRSFPILHASQKKGLKTLKRKAIERNQKITQLGRQRKWKEILSLCEQESSEFDNVNYATTMSQLSRIRNMNRRDPVFTQFFDDLATDLVNKGVTWIEVRQLANILHAIGKLQIKSTPALSILRWVSTTKVSRTIVEEGKPQEVANTAWSFATLGFKAPKLFDAIEHRADWLVEEGNPQDVANTVWSFATLGLKAPKLFGAIEHRADWLLVKGNHQDIANTAWSFATLGFKAAPKLFDAIEHRADWLVEEGKPQAVANTAWSFATLGVKAPKLFDAIEHRADWLVEEGNPQAIANTAWSFATLGVKAPKLFDAIEYRATWLVEEGSPQNVANTAWSFANWVSRHPSCLMRLNIVLIGWLRKEIHRTLPIQSGHLQH